MFFEVFEEHNEQMSLLIGKEYNEITLRRYRLCLRYFKEMLFEETKVEGNPLNY